MSANVSASLIPQLRHDAAAGTYCVGVADTDGLSVSMTFTIRVVHRMTMRIAAICCLAFLAAACEDAAITSPSETSIDVNSFSSIVNPGGAASREFTLTSGGTVAVTLTTTGPSGVTLGLGIGIPRSGGLCALSAGVEATAGGTAQIAMPAEAATYCAKVYDTGTLTGPTTFTIVISRP